MPKIALNNGDFSMTTEVTSGSQDSRTDACARPGSETKPLSSPSAPRSEGSELRGSASDTMSKVAETAQQGARQAADGLSQSASTLASDAQSRIKGLVNERVAMGAELIGHLAGSTRRAADDLDPNAPQISGLLRDASARMQEFSRTVRDKPVDELMETASNYARRQPAVLFGAAAVVGFALLRLFKSDSVAEQTPITSGLGAAQRDAGVHNAPSISPQG
jgi:ElaB/YqjD/DUF883 family membrane-anchored ribosome-binding protein